MSDITANPPLVPGSSNYDNSYSRTLQAYSISDTIATLSGGILSNLSDPVNARDAANKQYVIDNSSGDPGTNRTWKTAVKTSTTSIGGNVALSGLQIIDGVSLSNEDRVLVKNQTDSTENGIYLVQVGSWPRAIDCPLGIQASGTAVYSVSGSENSNKIFVCDDTSSAPSYDPLVFGQGITFTSFGQSTPGGSSGQVQFNDAGLLAGSSGLTWSGTVLTATQLGTNNIQSTNSLIGANIFTSHGSQINIGSNNIFVGTNVQGSGGTVDLGQQTGSMGDVSITGRESNLANIAASTVNIRSGNASVVCRTAGSVSLVSGYGNLSGSGGDINIAANFGGETGNGGSVYISGGTGGSTSGSGGSVFIRAGTTGSGIGTSGSVNITGPVNVIGQTAITGSHYITGSLVVGGSITGQLALANTNILVGSAGNIATAVAVSGDATLSNTGSLSLANTAVTPGSYTSANITVNSKGLITAASNGSGGSSSMSTLDVSGFSSLQTTSITNLYATRITAGSLNVTGTITGQLALNNGNILIGSGGNVSTPVVMSGDATLANTGILTLANTAVTPASYTSANITVDSKGRITAASNGAGGSSSMSTLNVSGPSTLQTTSITNLIVNSITSGFLNVTGTITGQLVLTNGNILIGSGGNVSTPVVMSGDASIANTGVLTLANTAVAAGSYTSANITVNSKGIITAASNGSGGNTFTFITTGALNVSPGGATVLQNVTAGSIKASSITVGTLDVSGSSMLQSATIGNAIIGSTNLGFFGNSVTQQESDGSLASISSILKKYGLILYFEQQGSKLVGTGYNSNPTEGSSISISEDGNTLAIGGPLDSGSIGAGGATWVFTRSGTVWSQQGSRLQGTGGQSTGTQAQGSSVYLSYDGNTLAIAASGEESVWIFTRTAGVWTQQIILSIAQYGRGVSLSSDGDTLAIGHYYTHVSSVGATSVFTRTAGIWTQQGSNLVGSGNAGFSNQGSGISLSSDGDTLAIGALADNSNIGATWIFTRTAGTWTQQGTKLVGSDATGASKQGSSISLSSDGNTLAIGGPEDNSGIGATWIFTRTAGTWTQQGLKLIGSGNTGNSNQGSSVYLSSGGDILAIGAPADNSNAGATWIFTRNAGTWTQRGTKIIGSGNTGNAGQGKAVSLALNGSLLAVGGSLDNSSVGAGWVFEY